MKNNKLTHTSLCTFILICFFAYNSFAQNSIKAILRSSNNFNEIVAEGEQYFKNKYPNISFSELSKGVHRDGEFVKFMRWRSYWKDALNPDGTLGNPAAYWQEQQKKGKNSTEKAINLYADVPWTNLSYENYIVSQIGLGRTTSMGFHPTNSNIFYVGAAIGGIWKTTDGGQSYTPLGDELPFMAVSSIVVNQDNPNIIYIAISDHVWYGPPSIGVYKSTDGGVSWQPTALSFNLPDDIRIYWMEADPNDSDKIFVATANGLYRTNDGFDTVIKVNSVNTFNVRVNLGNSNIVYQGGNNGEFYRSTDGGNTFNLVTDFGNGDVFTALTSLNTTKVYVRNASTLHKSLDSGASFTQTNTIPISNSVLIFSPSNENVLMAGNFETYRSDNDGASFYATTQWLGDNGLPSIHVDQRNIFYNPLESNYVYYCNDGGLYRYVISSNQFENLCDGLLITQFYDIAVSQTDANIIGGGSQDNGNVYRGSDGIWDDYAGTGDGMNQEIDPTNAGIRYWSYQNGYLRRWQNGSNTNIQPPEEAGAWEMPYRLDPNNPNRIIAGYSVVYESLNKGDSWTAISGVLDNGNDMEEIAIAPSNSNRIYTSRGNNLFVKNISNNTWTQKSMPASISDLEVDPLDMNTIYISVPGFTSGSKVYKSSDAGSTWINISGSLPNVSAGAIEIYHDIPGGLFVGTDAGVYYIDDEFEDWQEYGQLPHTRVEDIEIQYAAQLIRIGTHGRGVLEAPIIIETCLPGAADADMDGICDTRDVCPNFNNNLVGTACDDGDVYTSGETYNTACVCAGGASNLNHCAAAGSNGTGADWIDQVSLHTLSHSSTQTAYSDFRNQSTTLLVDESYTLSVGLNYSFPLDKVYAWIDFDRNGIFDSTDRILMSAIDANHTSVGTVTLPANMTLGATTMRVRVIYADPNPAAPCGNYFGEVEDYTIIVAAPCADIDQDEVCDDIDLCIGSSDVPLVLNTDPTANQEFRAVNTIESNVTINAPLDIVYVAGQSIDLKQEFEVVIGATFHAYIEDCTTQMLQRIENKINTITEWSSMKKESLTDPILSIQPNPFNGTTQLIYTLNKASSLQLFITDLSGKRLETILDSPWQAAGTYQIQWESPAHFSGMLLLSFKTADKIVVKKMMVNR